MRWRGIAAAVAALTACACGSAGEGPPDATAECPPRPDYCVDDCGVEACGVPNAAKCWCVAGEWRSEGCPVARSGSCNPVSQTGCCPGDKCALVTDQIDPFIGHVGCVPAGADALDDPCTEADTVGTGDSCAAGGQCYDGRCVQVCTSLPDSCVDGVCTRLVDQSGNPQPTEICLPSCDPLAQDCAVADEACYVGAHGGVCLPAGSAPADSDCGSEDFCAPGLQCIGSPATCHPLCGPVLDCWELDGDGNPTTPTACGCGAAAACGPTEICWPFEDGAGNVVSTAGYCVSEDALPTCSCSADPICTFPAAIAGPAAAAARAPR